LLFASVPRSGDPRLSIIGAQALCHFWQSRTISVNRDQLSDISPVLKVPKFKDYFASSRAMSR
jgi:hypothetical protein